MTALDEHDSVVGYVAFHTFPLQSKKILHHEWENIFTEEYPNLTINVSQLRWII